MYAKVFGSIRVFKDDKALVGTNIQAVTNKDEVTNHFLKVFTSHCIRKHGSLSNQDLKGAAAGGPAVMGGRGSKPGAQSAQDAQQMIISVMKELKKQYSSNMVNKNDVWTSCQGKMSKADFETNLEDLENEGTIYQGGNSETFCLTDE